MPILKKGINFLGKEAVKTGAEIAMDVAEGATLKDTAKRRVSERINKFVPGLIPQSGLVTGRRRRGERGLKKTLKTAIKGKKRKDTRRLSAERNKRVKRDIFS